MRIRPIVVLALLPVFAACGANSPPPIVSLADRACGAKPTLIGAPALALGKDNKIEIAVDGNAPCVQAANGSRSVYVAVALPLTGTPYVLSVRSAILGQTVFAPRMALLDGQGRTLREVPRSAFSFHGSDIYAAVRSHADEHFLVVFSDPGTVGQAETQIHESVQQDTYTSTGRGGTVTFTTLSGFDRAVGFTYAHNGQLTISAEPLPGVN